MCGRSFIHIACGKILISWLWSQYAASGFSCVTFIHSHLRPSSVNIWTGLKTSKHPPAERLKSPPFRMTGTNRNQNLFIPTSQSLCVRETSRRDFCFTTDSEHTTGTDKVWYADRLCSTLHTNALPCIGKTFTFLTAHPLWSQGLPR